MMYPSFAISLEQIKHRLKNGPIRIAQGYENIFDLYFISSNFSSTLLLEGDVDIDGLEVDGTLIVRAHPGM